MTASNDVAHDGEDGGRRHAAAADELDRQPEPLHRRGDLRAGAVDDADLVLARQLEHGRGRLGGDGAADLHDDAAHERYSALIRTYSYERSLVR